METIVQQYRSTFQKQVPADQQYWTMCGQCATADGKPLDGCELTQIVNEKLIIPSQFHGVEINPEIHKLNVSAFPQMNWHNDDFYHAMVVEHSKNNFFPAVVNVDLPQTPDGGAGYVSRIMAFLTASAKNDVLVVANLIFRMRYYTTKDGDYLVNLLNEYPQFRYAMREGNWKLQDEYYHYEGAGETGGRTWMGSVVFTKKG